MRTRKIAIIIVVIASLLVLTIFLKFFKISKPFNYETMKQSGTKQILTISVSPTITQSKTINSIFIPYWNIPNEEANLDNYDQLFYFGISAIENGVNENDVGYKNISSFVAAAKDKEKILVLRMLDTDINLDILKDKEKQQKIIDETIAIAKENDFNGIALDMEISSLILTDITDQINDFVQQFYTQVKTNQPAGGLKFISILYGDLFYRKRPFDVKFIADNSDEIMVMAYDFHKSIGEPGPNLQLDKGNKYDYDFKQMTDDFLKFVPKEKLTIIFGMYGYDWTVDEKKKPIKPAKALSLNDIKEGFNKNNCVILGIRQLAETPESRSWTSQDDEKTKIAKSNCLIKRDEVSKETEVNYVVSTTVDNIVNMEYHIVWFEDEKSVDYKKTYLQEKGINNFAYWVYGYF